MPCKQVFQILILLCALYPLNAQDMQVEWTLHTFGPDSFTMGTAIDLDHDGNIYVAGGGRGDFLVVKYRPNGDELWKKHLDQQAMLYPARTHRLANCPQEFMSPGFR